VWPINPASVDFGQCNEQPAVRIPHDAYWRPSGDASAQQQQQQQQQQRAAASSANGDGEVAAAAAVTTSHAW